MKKNMIAFNMPRFITSDSKLNLPLLIKSFIEKRRKATAEITNASLSRMRPNDSTGEKNNFKMNNTAANTSSSCTLRFRNKFSAEM
ncbi:MAG: hypothetical protein A2315_14810 [Ignavibacteria bacterium RIFOXYB2_FULL_35_12]|nr:MAG: hypothetical protein A2006_15020 [Ignavibacteria bacterium GWC2_35_8]OGU81165.1 MAG: hypothetical protein A2254_00090 [Ignavibacteria bacterium RIFOXYA2_FULL_35_9]OGU99594.1 MAG: hypothetical protein A2455_00090 [Ignavibacteria bacterium RIFOXYC2_FULL_35_16]OGV04485.1 MAG: hypothetical protein A2315_14810 [Ignavibacteria bacterium RIFOXYB2_FULL_35_12]